MMNEFKICNEFKFLNKMNAKNDQKLTLFTLLQFIHAKTTIIDNAKLTLKI